MPKGGLRPGAGRPPQEHSRARDRAAAKAAKAGTPASSSTSKPARPMLVVNDGDWLTLAPEGRPGNPPAWPLTTPATPAERRLWNTLWKTKPQALGWDAVGAESQVALYIRTRVRAEQPDSPIGLTNLVIRYEHDLGLTAVGMRMLHWRIGRTVAAAATSSADEPADGERFPSPKERYGLKVVQGGA